MLGYAGSRSLASLALGLLPAGVTALMSNSRPLIVVMAGLLVFHLRVGRPEVAATLVGFSVVALLSAGDVQATGDLGFTVLGSGLARPRAGRRPRRSRAVWVAPIRWSDCAYERHRRTGRRPGRAAQPGLESVAIRVCASHRGQPTLRTDRMGA